MLRSLPTLSVWLRNAPSIGVLPTVTAALPSTRNYALERNLGAPNAKHPSPDETLVEETETIGKNEGFDVELKDKMKKYSGTAEDVHVKDQAKGGFNKMAADPKDVERQYKEKAFDVAKSTYNRSPREN